MMRLIDANKLIEQLDGIISDYTSNGAFPNGYDINSAIDSLTDAPTIDPETLPIVRQLREELARVTAERDAIKKNPPVEIQADAFALAVELAKVTAERDAAVEQLHGYCFACKHYTPYHNDGLCATCKHERACFKPWDAVDRWQWRGPQKKG